MLAEQYPIFGGTKVATLAAKESQLKKASLEKSYYRNSLSIKEKKPIVYRPLHQESEQQVSNSNESWACDYTTSKLWNGKKMVWFIVLDECTRECLLAEAGHTWSVKRFTNRLHQLMEERGKPREFRIDNAILWHSVEVINFARQHHVELSHSTKASPWENARVESFIATFHREFLQQFSFINSKNANEAAGLFIELYNNQRPHSSLEGTSPRDFRRSQPT